MNTFDLTPIFHSTVGFDRLMDMFDDIVTKPSSYPPYNISKQGSHYKISMAIAGFSKEDLKVTLKENELSIEGCIQKTDSKEEEFLHKGIAQRGFDKKFKLDEFIRVDKVSLENGILCIFLIREIPEAKKEKQLTIQTPESIIDYK